MAVDMFIKISSPDIKGESADHSHKEEIDVLSWSWGASNTGSMHQPGAGGGTGKANFNDLSFTKYVDVSSPMLLKACSTGEHIKKAVLIVRKAGGKDPLEYIKVTLEDCLISSVSTGGSGGEERLTENVTINFGKFKLEYNPQTATGTGKGWMPFAYNIQANKIA